MENMKNSLSIILALILLLTFNIIDYYQTIYAVSIYGIDIEFNPIGRLILKTDYAWIVKLLFVSIVIIIMGIVTLKNNSLRWWLYLLTIFYFCVVIHNFYTLWLIGAL